MKQALFKSLFRAHSVLVEKNANVTTIILNRPSKRNAIDAQCAHLLSTKIREFEADENAKVAVLYGGASFCSGADLIAIKDGTGNRLEVDGDAPLGPTRLNISKPIIAAISGAAVAGGLELALWCDLRIAEEDAVLGVFCRRFGVPLIDGGTVRLPRLIGLSRAMDLILTGRPVYAKEALDMGLVNRVVPKGCSRQAAEELAAQIAAHPNACMLADRRSTYAQHGLSIDEAMRQEFRGGYDVLQSHEHTKAVLARFVTKQYKTE
jgi:enoyl-CoA hydratase